MKKLLVIILLMLLTSFLVFALKDISEEDQQPVDPPVKVNNYVYKADRNTNPRVDHSEFEILKQEFKSAHDVTAACLSCHNRTHLDVMGTSHWLWQRSEELKGKGVVPLGKRNILNNFCIGVSGSEATCTRCHIGYGYADKNFNFDEPTNIDCLVCHDNSGTYKKAKGGAGYPDESVDLNYVAQNIGTSTRANCGVCHFWGGGGNNVKHGDLEISMTEPTTEIDVHMGIDGEDMQCVECHTTERHQMAGKLYALSSENKNRATCEQCHTNTPHKDKLLNEHNLRVACQTCHIPVYAKVNSTKMWWDWSTAGRLDENGNQIHESDADGNHNYLSIKGNFVYDDHVIPEYYWFNGTANHQLITDKIDTVPVQMNTLYGSYKDKGTNGSGGVSKIWPVKVHRGKQIYDPVNKTLIQPKLWSKNVGDSAYWKDFDWNKAAAAGMKYLGLPYSGQYDFIETEMYWPLNHMVSKKEKSLTCVDCHTRHEGRLADLTDFYLPGRDRSAFLDGFGILVILGTLLGVIIHAVLRRILRKKCFFQNESIK
jgi:octaheme c-type cytochrome (tetrathionate reductase family)